MQRDGRPGTVLPGRSLAMCRAAWRRGPVPSSGVSSPDFGPLLSGAVPFVMSGAYENAHLVPVFLPSPDG